MEFIRRQKKRILQVLDTEILGVRDKATIAEDIVHLGHSAWMIRAKSDPKASFL